MPPIVNTQNVLVGAAAFFYQPYVATTPPVMPIDSLGFVDVTSANAFSASPSPTWASPWLPGGATEAGLQLQVQRTTQDQNIEEQSTPVVVSSNAGQVQVAVSFAEDTLETMKLAYGGGTITTVAAATGVPGTRELVLQEGLDVVAVGFEGRGPKGQWRRVLIPQMVATGNVQTDYRRSANNRVYAVTFRALVPLNQIRIREWNAAALP
jgi:hypothetical protein